jgi:hypothetical protein
MGMVNISELSIKAPSCVKEPKEADRLRPKGKAGGQLINFLSCTDNNPAGAETEPNPIVLNERNKVNPIVRPSGRLSVSEAIG